MVLSHRIVIIQFPRGHKYWNRLWYHYVTYLIATGVQLGHEKQKYLLPTLELTCYASGDLKAPSVISTNDLYGVVNQPRDLWIKPPMMEPSSPCFFFVFLCVLFIALRTMEWLLEVRFMVPRVRLENFIGNSQGLISASTYKGNFKGLHGWIWLQNYDSLQNPLTI